MLSKFQVEPNSLIKFLVIIIGVVIILHFASNLLLPVALAILLATLLDRPMEKMCSWGWPRWLAITMSVLMMLLILGIVAGLVTWQVNNIANDWGEIEQKAGAKIDQLNQWFSANLGVKPAKYFSDTERILTDLRGIIGSMAISFTNVLTQSIIILIYIIVLLMQKQQFHNFLYKLFPKYERDAVAEMLFKAGNTVRNYLVGRGKIMIILFVVYLIGFWVGKVPYALFLALFAALFSIIPYVGNFIGGGVAVLLSFIYAGLSASLIVVAVIMLSQLVENYVLTPWIVGDSIDLNAFITIFGVLALSAVWGVIGAVIALPIFGVLKVFFQHTKGMEAYAYIMGQTDDTATALDDNELLPDKNTIG